MNQGNLDRIIDEVTARTLVGNISVSIEKIAEEIAKEALSDEEFRESLHALVRAASRKIMAQLLATEQETMTTEDRLKELHEKLSGLAWCDHEAGICTGACHILDEIDELKRIPFPAATPPSNG